MLKGVFFIAREDIAIYKGEALFELLDQLDVNVLKSYRNNHGCSEILEYLAEVAEQDLITELTKCRFYGFQVDETTDV